MKTIWKTIMIFFVFSLAILLSACNGNGQDEALRTNDANDGANINNVSHDSDLNDPSVIPSENGDKTDTTNKNGTSYDGMGNDTYGSIGSSGIHEGGLSSFLESKLKGVGITGVKVFAIDDSVVLARKDKQTTSHEYDNLQNDVLSGTEGMSGKGEPKGVNDSKNKSHDNLDQAKEKMNKMFNGNVKILTVTDPKAIDLINSIKENIKAVSYQAAADDLLKLLKMTKE
ncbi:hypothetical protein CFK37_17035 [Virgibacillus phasianinus]|uniref:Sporulation protein n=1 Tax=Virgibacillus phasianinus TaxID=2017483 RepID=A0A220U6M3_9BACI|nr:hypothetical protein [Virgibacillus phasianinus]ASK63740.1 hypothetical protein CFK37_17035 [Virgibacillus phasianinus]